MKKWNLLLTETNKAADRAKREGIPFILAKLLEARGIQDTDAFFKENDILSDPFQMADMQRAVERIWKAVESFEKIAVYGDYDVDGVTATAILYEYLESCGANVMFYIPDREDEGYGLNCKALQSLREQDVSLVITVDNGISCSQEVEYAKSIGVDVVITDHHQPLDVLPAAVAVVDPHRADCKSVYKQFSGVGVAFKLIMALEGSDCDIQSLLDNYADFVALGTIGDVVPLTGENRYLVKYGLELLNRTDHPGLCALIRTAGLEDKRLSAEMVAYTLIPRINATGRMGDPSRAVHLLITEDEQQAEELAEEICEENEKRKQIESEIFDAAINQLKERPQRLLDRVLVVDGENWHPGVIGIVAAKLSDRFGKPAIVIAKAGEEARGSGRSVGNFSLFEAVCSCESLLTKYGGHPVAAGMTLPSQNIDTFRVCINQYASRMKVPKPEITIDCLLELKELSPDLLDEYSYMEPFGAQNPSPVFGLFGVVLEQVFPVAGGKHLRISVSQNGTKIQCMRFGVSPEQFGYRPGDSLDLVVTLSNRQYQGNTYLSVCVKELRPAGMDTGNLLSHKALFEQAKRGEKLTEKQFKILFPSRENFAQIYRFIRNTGGYNGPLELLASCLPEIPLARILVCLDVLSACGLIQKSGENILHIQLLPAKGKCNLFDSAFLGSLERQKIV